MASHSGDIVLLPETLDYMNRIADSFVMHAAGGDPPIPYKKGMSYYPFYEVIAAFTGENSVLQGQKDGNDMIVSKDDVKAFMVNILAWEPPADNPDLDPGCFYDEDSYVVYDYNGDEEKPIVIHNIRMDGPDRIRMTVPKHATSYDFVFERNWGSTYEWILVEVVDNNEEIFESEVMTQALYEHGIVVPGDGSPALTSLSSGQELSMEGAEAQMRQYLKYVGGGIAETVVAEDWGLIANSYYTYKVTVTDTNQIYLIGTSDAALAEYHGDDVPRTWFDWNLME